MYINMECNENYELTRLLGAGTYADVYMAKDKRKKDITVSLKKYNKNVIETGVSQAILREIVALKACNHPNIVQLLDIDYQKFSYLALEYYDFTLSEIIEHQYSSLPFTSNHIQNIFYQVLQGLNYLHNNNIIHRDIKANNIVLSYYSKKNYYQVAIADMGAARIFHSVNGYKTPEIVTLWERPPEILQKGYKNYNSAVDIWSLGCTIAYTLRRKHLFTAETELHMLQQIYNLCSNKKDNDTLFIKTNHSNKLLTSFKNCDKVVVDLIQHMLRIEPSDRITAVHALGHPYFTGIHPSKIYNIVDKKHYLIQYKRSYVGIRVELLNWLTGVMYKYDLPIDVYLLTVKILDRYIMTLTPEEISDYDHKDWHCIILTCFWIADKIEEVEPFSLDSLSDIYLEEFTDQTIITLEARILRVLNCDICCLLMTDYTDHLDKKYILTKKQKAIKEFLIYYSSYSLTLCIAHPKQVIEAIYLYLLDKYDYSNHILKIIGYNINNNKDFNILTTCLEKIIELAARDIRIVVGKLNKTKLVKFKGYKYLTGG